MQALGRASQLPLAGRGPGCQAQKCTIRGLPHLRSLPRHRLILRAESPIVEEVAGLKTGYSVFNRARWRFHQSSTRYSRHIASIFRSVTFRNLQSPLSFLTLNAAVIVLYRALVEMETLPDLFEGIKFVDTPFQLTSFALSLLLVFRTDASYGRWCAAMDAWGTLRSSSANLIRKACAWVDDPAHLGRLVRWQSAFCRTLMVVLRNDLFTPQCKDAIRRELRKILQPHELEQVLAAGPYYPQFCLSVLTALVETSGVNEGRETAMLEDIQEFNMAVGTCEKLLRFPIPLTYTRHTSRFMLIYLAALPLVLYDSSDWAAVPVTAVIAFLLLGIEDIGVQIEEPFAILPLGEICDDIAITMQRAVQQRNMVRCLADPAQCRAVLSYDDDDDATSGNGSSGAGLATVVAAEPLAGQSSPYNGRSAGAVAAMSAPSGASGLGEIAGGSSSSSSSAAGVSSASGNGTFVSTRSRRE